MRGQPGPCCTTGYARAEQRTGSAARGRYVKHMVHDARQHGLRAVVFNSRGTSDGPVTTPQFYSASYTGDMRAVVAAVQRRYPQSPLLAAGWSLGGAHDMALLAQPPRTLTCSTAQCICPAEHRCCPVATCIESICERAQQTSWSDIWVRRAARRPFSWRCPWPTRSTWSARRQPAAQLMQPCNQGSSKPECYTAQVISDDNFKVGFNRCVRGLHVRSAAEQRQPWC